jgi:hypothetical protein
MWKTGVIMLIGLFTLTGLAAATNRFEVGTITGVTTHRGAAGADPSITSYDVSVKVGGTVYVVLYTPPLDTRVVQYAAGRQLLVRVGEKTIAFNDELGTTSEVPILSQTTVAPQAAPAAHPALAPIQSVQLLGLPGLKNNTKGTLSVEGGALLFASSKGASVISLTNVEDVITGNDSQRVIRGKLGTISMFGPYGSGRFLSLFRSKLDTLTIKYRDGEGGLHGAVFTMAVGQAEPLKQELVARGAHSSTVIEVEASVNSSKAVSMEEQP